MTSYDAKILDSLITTTIDSADGFADAAADASDSRLKSIFAAFAADRREIAEQLRTDASRLGGDASAQGSLKAAAHRRWMDVKNALTRGDEAILGSVEAGETYLRTKYETALADDGLSEQAREAISDAFVSVARGQARVIELRRCLGLPQRQEASGGRAMPALLGLAALVGSAYVARRIARPQRQPSRRRAMQSIQVDEDARLISSKKVESTPVVNASGVRLGTIDSFMVDKYTGEVAYAVMSHGGTLGMGGDLLPLPWALLSYDTGKGGYVIDMTTEDLKQAPRYEAEEDPEFSGAYRQKIARYFGTGQHGRFAH